MPRLRRQLASLLALVAALSAGQLHAQDGALPVGSAPEAVLRPGDAVRITVYGHQELTGEFPVTGDGYIAHPIYRTVRVVGVPQDEIERRVQEILYDFDAQPRFVVEPLVQVVVGGEVRQPNLYALSPEMTVSQAVGLAGGVTDRARLDRVRLIRDGVEHRLDLTAPDAAIREMNVQSGDQIIVDRRVSIFREYIAPAGSIASAIVSVIALIVR